MPRGDRYHIPEPAWTKGPQRTIKALNADSKILKDIADRVCDLEVEQEQIAAVASQTTITVAAIRNGQAVYYEDVISGEVNAL
jgi:hypothetical protein